MISGGIVPIVSKLSGLLFIFNFIFAAGTVIVGAPVKNGISVSIINVLSLDVSLLYIVTTALTSSRTLASSLIVSNARGSSAIPRRSKLTRVSNGGSSPALCAGLPDGFVSVSVNVAISSPTQSGTNVTLRSAFAPALTKRILGHEKRIDSSGYPVRGVRLHTIFQSFPELLCTGRVCDKVRPTGVVKVIVFAGRIASMLNSTE